MNNTARLGVLFSLLAFCGSSSADGLELEEWIKQYEKLGGITFLNPDKDCLGIQKREGQKPLISLKGSKPAAIREVFLQGYEIADEDLEALAGWAGLEQITVVDGKKITDKGAKAVAALPNLRRIVLDDTAVTEAGLNAFSGHKKLIHLDVSNASGNKVQNLDLKEMPELQSVVLSFKGMASIRLAKLPKLELVEFPLELEQAEISEAGALAELDFRGTKLKKLVLWGLPKLESLNLGKTPLSAADVAAVQRSVPGAKVKR